MTERPDYDALAQDINVKDITSCERNAMLLRKIRDGDPNWNKELYIMARYNEDADLLDFVVDLEEESDFFVDEGDDLGLLGYFIGKSTIMEILQIENLPEGGDEISRFFEGMSQNRSIKILKMYIDIGVDGWSSLGGFLENNRNLSRLEFRGIMIGHESAQNLASALGRMHHNSLKHLSMDSSGIGDEGLAEIATALRSQPRLENLSFVGNNIGRGSCIALGNTLSRWPVSNKLEALHIDNNAIDDEGLQILASGLMNCCNLKELYLSHNQSITADGLRSLLPLLQSESHSMESLGLFMIAFGDDGAMILAEGLRGNKSLEGLWFIPSASGMTSVGWSAFSTLLCDTSTINNTYLSNHTLTNMGYHDNKGTPEDIQWLLATNTYEQAAICKILRSHPDLDMEPFFKLNMQFLPAVISWFDRVEPTEEELNEDGLIEYSERSCQSRKLSALYKFVRAMPDLTTIGYWEGRMIHIEAERLRLADEMRRLDDEEDITRKRLGMSGQPMDEASASRNKRMRLE